MCWKASKEKPPTETRGMRRGRHRETDRDLRGATMIDSRDDRAMTDGRESHPADGKFFWFGDRCIAFHDKGRLLGCGRMVTPSGTTVYACAILGLVVSFSRVSC